MGGNHIESKRAVIALCCPAGTGTDGTLTLADTTGLCLNESNTTSALYKIKLKCKVKCFVVFFIFAALLYWFEANIFHEFILYLAFSLEDLFFSKFAFCGI